MTVKSPETESVDLRDRIAEKAPFFARDMKRLREQQGVTIDNLHEATKIPRGVIEEFERNALVRNEMFNRVYLRSLVKSYAAAANIDAMLALHGLENLLDGRYAGDLVTPLHDAKDQVDVISTSPPDRRDRDSRSRKAKRRGKADKTRESSAARDDKKKADPEAAVAEPDPEPGSADLDDPTLKEPVADPPAHVSPQPIVKSTPTISAALPTADAAGSSIVLPRSGLMTIALGGIGLVVVAGLIGFGLFLTRGESDAGSQPVEAPTPLVEEATPAPTIEAPPPPVHPVLGERMAVTITAVGGKLEPVRVTTDSAVRRPYWVRENDSEEFTVSRFIRFEGRVDRIALAIDGHQVDASSLAAGRNLELTRESAQELLNQITID